MDNVIYNEAKRKRLVQAILKLYRKKKLDLDSLLHDIMIIEIGDGDPPLPYKRALYKEHDLHIPSDQISAFKPHVVHYMTNMHERLLLALYGYKQFEQFKTYTRRAIN